MKNFSCRLLALLLLLSGGTLSLRADEAPTAMPAEVQAASPDWTLAIPVGVSAADALKDAQVALINRGWTITGRGEGMVQATNKNKKVEALAWIEVRDGNLVARSQAWKLDKAGNRLRPREASGWMDYLLKDIRKAFQFRALDAGAAAPGVTP